MNIHYEDSSNTSTLRVGNGAIYAYIAQVQEASPTRDSYWVYEIRGWGHAEAGGARSRDEAKKQVEEKVCYLVQTMANELGMAA